MKKAIVVGAGMPGLSTAWYLQEHGYEVEVLEKTGIAAGASWGNAGWLAPAKAIPLADPSLWRYGPRALLDPDAALAIPPRLRPALWLFLLRFMARATRRSWEQTMAALTPIDRVALAAFDELELSGVEARSQPGPFVIGFENESQSQGFLREIHGVVRHGQEAPLTRLAAPRELAPMLSEQVQVAYALAGQRFIEPGPYLEALGSSFRGRGGKIRVGAEVVRVARATGEAPAVLLRSGERLSAAAVVLATGAWLPRLARPLGVRIPVQAGRGYSFSVATEVPAQHPVYLPHHRIACTPYQGRFRIAGTMEFRSPDEPLHPRRIQAIVRQAGRLLTGVDLERRQEEWVGSRPVTPDGLPLVGRTGTAHVYVAGGHGMWGVVLGPATGKYLAELIATGETSPVIRPFDPLR